MEIGHKDFDKVTLEECIDMYEIFDCSSVIEDGHLVMFVKENPVVSANTTG